MTADCEDVDVEDYSFDAEEIFEEGYDQAVKEILSYLRDLSMHDAGRVVSTRFKVKPSKENA